MHMSYLTQPIKWVICNAYDKTHNIFSLVIRAQGQHHFKARVVPRPPWPELYIYIYIYNNLKKKFCLPFNKNLGTPSVFLYQ